MEKSCERGLVRGAGRWAGGGAIVTEDGRGYTADEDKDCGLKIRYLTVRALIFPFLMFLLRELPNQECLAQLLVRYPQIEPDAMLAVMQFIRTGADVSECFERFLAKHGLSQGRFAILMYLNRKPGTPINQTHLAEAYGVTKATITGLIDGLERDGMVERLADPADRRASLVQLTEASRTFLDAFLPAHFRGVSELMAGLDAAERAELIRLVGKIRDGIARVTCGGASDCGSANLPTACPDRSSRTP